MANRTSKAGSVASNAFAQSDDINAGPGGLLAYVFQTNPQNTITSSTTVLTGLTTPVTVGSLRIIRVVGIIRMETTVGGDDLTLQLQEGGTVLDAAAIATTRASIPYGLRVEATLINPSAGTHTYFMAGGRAAGTGVITTDVDATHPGRILVYDDGASF